MAAYQDVHDTWGRLSRDGHVGMTDAFQIVLSAAVWQTAAPRTVNNDGTIQTR